MSNEITIPAEIKIRRQHGVAVLAQPSCLDPMLGRISAQVDPGLSLVEMVDRLLPQATGVLRDRLRITVSGHVVLPGHWHVVQPKPGAQVMIRAVPGNDILRNVLTIAVTVAAVALGQVYAPELALAAGLSQGTASAVITTSTPSPSVIALNLLATI